MLTRSELRQLKAEPATGSRSFLIIQNPKQVPDIFQTSRVFFVFRLSFVVVVNAKIFSHLHLARFRTFSPSHTCNILSVHLKCCLKFLISVKNDKFCLYVFFLIERCFSSALVEIKLIRFKMKWFHFYSAVPIKLRPTTFTFHWIYAGHFTKILIRFGINTGYRINQNTA